MKIKKPKLKTIIIVTMAIGLIGTFIVSWVTASKLIAAAPKIIITPDLSIPIEDISLTSLSGSTLSGWHIQSNQKKGVVILVHGIRANRTSMIERAKFLYDAGYSSVLIDLQAHGESTGDMITMGHLEKHDVKATIEYVKETHPLEPIGLIGVSLGGAAATLASPLNIDAVILESVYTDISQAIHNRVSIKLGPLSWLPAEILIVQIEPRIGVNIANLRPIDKIQSIASPVFIISGKNDLHTTEAESRSFFNEAKQPKELWLLDNAKHVNLYKHSPTLYKSKVLEFLKQHMSYANEQNY
jgi:alpha-beta hydrolase superfamily lysophospholipase